MNNILVKGRTVEDPPLAKFLFSDVRSSILWLPLRIWVGIQWFNAGLHKVEDPAWVTTGEALKKYWANSLGVTTGKATISFDWYKDFIQALYDGGTYTWFAKLIAYGEVLVGIGLVVGAFVGLAAFFGALMNFSFIMAGSASSNGLLLVLAFFLLMAWKVAGYLGADFFLLRWLGVPWGHGHAPPKVKSA